MYIYFIRCLTKLTASSIWASGGSWTVCSSTSRPGRRCCSRPRRPSQSRSDTHSLTLYPYMHMHVYVSAVTNHIYVYIYWLYTQDLARLSLKDAEYLGVHEREAEATPITLVQTYVVVKLEDKLDTLFSFLRTHLKCKIIVFLSTCSQVCALWAICYK